MAPRGIPYCLECTGTQSTYQCLPIQPWITSLGFYTRGQAIIARIAGDLRLITGRDFGIKGHPRWRRYLDLRVVPLNALAIAAEFE